MGRGGTQQQQQRDKIGKLQAIWLIRLHAGNPTRFHEGVWATTYNSLQPSSTCISRRNGKRIGRGGNGRQHGQLRYIRTVPGDQGIVEWKADEFGGGRAFFSLSLSLLRAISFFVSFLPFLLFFLLSSFLFSRDFYTNRQVRNENNSTVYIYILNFVANKFQKWSFLYILIFALSTSI